jgi:hypothetical protein
VGGRGGAEELRHRGYTGMLLPKQRKQQSR